jgi:hypothetical protein
MPMKMLAGAAIALALSVTFAAAQTAGSSGTGAGGAAGGTMGSGTLSNPPGTTDSGTTPPPSGSTSGTVGDRHRRCAERLARREPLGAGLSERAK